MRSRAASAAGWARLAARSPLPRCPALADHWPTPRAPRRAAGNRVNYRETMRIGPMLLALGIVATMGGSAGIAQNQPKLSEKQATEVGTDVYVYGYPLVTFEMTGA